MAQEETFEQADIAVIGAGIAGASVAAELAERFKVVLVERESQPGYHTTGRSAALFSETYGPAVIRALSQASAGFYDHPYEGFADAPLLHPRGVFMVARADQIGALDALEAELRGEPGVSRIDAGEVRRRMPLVREGYCAGAIFEAGARDIDVHALHQGYLRLLRRRGGAILRDFEVTALERTGGRWRIDGPARRVEADMVVNAAGAWADEIGRLAGAHPISLQPKRRTAMIIDMPGGPAPADWPMVVDVEEEFYLKADAGRLLISPADETPSPPCDAQPDEYDVALCIDRIERAFDLKVARIENKWAGLRSFVADKTPVAGFDPDVEGFFWLAGQGGYGIQTAPALSRVAARLVADEDLPEDVAARGVTRAALSVSRRELAA